MLPNITLERAAGSHALAAAAQRGRSSSHAHAWLRRHEAGGGVAADRGARRSRDPGAVRLLPPLARRRRPDMGRARDDASRRRLLPAGRAPDHAAHDRVPELRADLLALMLSPRLS